MRTQILRHSCTLLLLSLCASTHAKELTFAATSNAVVRDFTGSGVFTQFQVPFSGLNLSVRKFNFEVPSGTPRNERSLVAFDVRTLNNEDALKAYLDFRIVGYTGSSERVGIFAYNSNGVLSTADATRSARLLASYNPVDLGLGPHSIELDFNELNLLTTPFTQYIGVRFQALDTTVNTQIAHIASSSNYPPRLRIFVVPEPANYGPLVLLAIGCFGGCTGSHRRRHRLQTAQ